MEHFTPISALAGGILIGVAASILLAFNGRIAGISGVVGELLVPGSPRKSWRLAFVAGLFTGGLLLLAFLPGSVVPHPARSLPAVAVAGLIVGFGTRMGNGCTSGHGVCGIPRGSVRSITATVTFIATGILTVALVNALAGGVL